MKNATLCFLVRGNPPHEILLGLKKAGFGAGKYNGFGGKIEDGESVVDAAIREVEEEVGIKVSEADLQQVAHLTFVFLAEPDLNHNVCVFLCSVWRGEPAESEEMEPRWFAVSDIPFDQMWQDDALWLPQVLDGRRVRGHFTFGEDNETVTSWEVESLNDRVAPGE